MATGRVLALDALALASAAAAVRVEQYRPRIFSFHARAERNPLDAAEPVTEFESLPAGRLEAWK